VPGLAAFGIGPQHAGEIAAKAATSSSMQGNPVALSHADLKAILLQAVNHAPADASRSQLAKALRLQVPGRPAMPASSCALCASTPRCDASLATGPT
jgi:hypothetical protein